MNIKQSRLKRTRDDELAPLCQLVHDRAEANLAALADYNITAAKLADLQTAIDNFKSDTPKPRTAVSTRKITNNNIAAAFKELDDLFDLFDKQIESLTEDHADFAKTYLSNRELLDSATKAKKPDNAKINGEIENNK